MTYCGIARTTDEVKAALSLATLAFYPSYSGEGTAFSHKQFMLTEHPGFNDRSTIVLCNDLGMVVGSAFVIDCSFPVGDKAMSGAFISSVSIAEPFKGKGLSVRLMASAIIAATARGADIAVVIARRAVDGYYNRFGFWGVSQYSKVGFNVLSVPQSNVCQNSVNLLPAMTSDLEECASLYDETYRFLLGHCSRNPQMWRYIQEKLARLDLKFHIIRDSELVIAYAVHDGKGLVYEIGIKPNFDWCVRSFFKAISPSNENVSLHIPPTHPILVRLAGADVTNSLRECSFGGHMVRILNSESVAFVRDSTQSLKLIRNDNIQLKMAETAELLGAARVTGFDPMQANRYGESFNIPFLDQI